MITTARENITGLPYSMHDMRITGFETDKNRLTLNFKDGFEKVDGGCCVRVEGSIEFITVDWDFSYAYVLDFLGNTGRFEGEKLMLTDFIKRFGGKCFEVIDETYGYNRSKFAGELRKGAGVKECFIEIYHLGDMRYIEWNKQGNEDNMK